MNNGARVQNVVPTPAELTGDFSHTTYPAVNGLPGGPLPAYGTPTCTAVQNAGYDCMPVDPTTGLNDWGTQVPAAVQTAGLGWWRLPINFWRAPTVGQPAEGVTNFITNIPGPLTMNQQTYRGDQNLGQIRFSLRPLHPRQLPEPHAYNSGSIDYGIEQYFQTEDAGRYRTPSASAART